MRYNFTYELQSLFPDLLKTEFCDELTKTSELLWLCLCSAKSLNLWGFLQREGKKVLQNHFKEIEIMCEILQNEKNRFLADEFFAGAWNAAVQRNTTFAKLDTEELKGKKAEFRECLKKAIFEMLPSYAETQVSHEQHLKNIEVLMEASKDFSDILKDCGTEEDGKSDSDATGMKAATAQKILNVMLKYCWCVGWINMPPDMPIDSRVLAELRKLDKNEERFQISWTKALKEIDDYKKVITAAADTVMAEEKESLAIWELKKWKHYVDENQ